MTDDRPQITYEQASAAFQAGQKLHFGGRIFLVRPTLRTSPAGSSTTDSAETPVLWVTDQRTLGDHGLLLFPDGSVEAR